LALWWVLTSKGSKKFVPHDILSMNKNIVPDAVPLSQRELEGLG